MELPPDKRVRGPEMTCLHCSAPGGSRTRQLQLVISEPASGGGGVAAYSGIRNVLAEFVPVGGLGQK